MEKGGIPIVQGVTGILDLTAPASTTAWPIAGFSYLVMRVNAVRLTCANKNAMLKFWYW
jgi:hypothetical protein